MKRGTVVSLAMLLQSGLPLPLTAGELRGHILGDAKVAPGAPVAAIDSGRPEPDWIAQHDGILELKLIHEGEKGIANGILRLDHERRLLFWESIPGEAVWNPRIEASFDDVLSVRRCNDGGFLLALRREKGGELVFIPLPDAPLLGRVRGAPGAERRSFSPNGPAAQTNVLTGDSTLDASRTLRVDLPPEVTKHANSAVTRIREAIGRGPSSSAAFQEALHGPPIDISVQQLLKSPDTYLARTVRLHGLIQKDQVRAGVYRLIEGKEHVAVTPLEELAAVVAAQVPNERGLNVEITGVLKRQFNKVGTRPVPSVAFWEYYAPNAAATRGRERSERVALEDLVTRPGMADGRLVRVIGKFRGRNIYGDVPAGVGDAWVIKAGKHPLVVKGKKPSGAGFELDPDSTSDTVNWLEVVGRPKTRDGLTVLNALSVTLAVPPPRAEVQPPRFRLRGVTGPALIVFTLPLNGEQAIDPDSPFLVQFSAHMNEDSFQGHIRLRYEDGADLPGIKWQYDDERRALMLDPGEPLQPGRRLELLFLPGVVDAEGAPLAPRGGAAIEGPVERLLYEVGGQKAPQ